MEKINVTIWTSSHGKGDFRKKIKEVFENSKFEPIVKAKGGLWMSFNLAKAILKDMELKRRPQIHIIILGDNNLRGERMEKEDVMKIFRFFIARARKIPKSRVILSSLIPSVEHNEKNNEIFNNFDEELAKILDKKYEYLNLRKSMRSKTGEIKEKLFKSDGVHLNEDGNDVLSKQIYNKVDRMPLKFFE